jgi:hypothetical protein
MVWDIGPVPQLFETFSQKKIIRTARNERKVPDLGPVR